MLVYFIQGQTTQLIKIGQTAKSVSSRLKELQSNSPDKLKVLKAIEAEKGAEQFLHEKFQSVRSHGEWFYPSCGLMNFIESSNKIELPKPEDQLSPAIPEYVNAIGDNINRLLKDKGITHYQLSKITGIGHDSMSLYRNAKRKPGIVNLKKIAEALSVSTDELIKI